MWFHMTKNMTACRCEVLDNELLTETCYILFVCLNLQAHLYLSEEEKLSREDQCCGLEKIAPSDACCNGIGYNPLSHVCADRSSMGDGGCGLGVICPVDQAVTAYCDR